MIELLACAGLCAILMYGKPTEPIRILAKAVRLESLFKCALCTGFWVSLFFALLTQQAPWFPFAGAAFCWFLDAAVNAMREVYLEK